MGTNSTRAPDSATTLSTKDDAAIIAAWDRRVAAFSALRELPDQPETGMGETPEQLAQWAIVDVAEAEIRAAVATTPRGAEIQLWTAVTYIFDGAYDEAPCYRGDLDYYEAKGEALDWTDKLLISALRSLREQGK